MDVENKDKNNNNIPKDFYKIVSKILSFLDDVNSIKKSNEKKKGE